MEMRSKDRFFLLIHTAKTLSGNCCYIALLTISSVHFINYMSKLTAQDTFIDVSDYGRPIARWIARRLTNTSFTPIHVTYLFGISGLIAVYCIVARTYYWAAFFLIWKSILDAADGELSRLKNTPSYTGRYLDSVFDIILNALIIAAIGYVSNSSFVLMLLAFICIQLQGTLYNYYYVILRNKSVGGDITSKVFEQVSPKAFPNESQTTVDILFAMYNFCYAVFDKSIYYLDKNANTSQRFPNWFMTMISVYGLGFQLFIIAMMLNLALINYILPFFIAYTFLLVIFIAIRKNLLRK